MNLERYSWSALACLIMFSTAHAEDTKRYSATASVHGDENDYRQWLGKLGLSVGGRWWAHGLAGKMELANAGANDTSIIGAGLGVGGQTVSAAVDFVQRSGDARFKQQDWTASLNWHGARVGIGADVFVRSASSETSTTRSGGALFAPPVTTTIREAADAKGFGLHGDFSLTSRARVFAGAMHYRYDFARDSAAPAANTPLSFLLGTDAAFTGVSRDQAFIERTYRVGGSYGFRSAAVSAQYTRDRIARIDESFETVQLQAEFPIAEHWLISPTVGYSSGDSMGRTGFAGLSLSLNW